VHSVGFSDLYNIGSCSSERGTCSLTMEAASGCFVYDRFTLTALHVASCRGLLSALLSHDSLNPS